MSSAAARDDLGIEGGRIVPSVSAVVATLVGLGAAWVAAGSAGLMADGLRHALVWLAAAAMLLAGWQRPTGWQQWAGSALVAIIAVTLVMPAAPVYNVLAVGLVLSLLAWWAEGADRRLLELAAGAVVVLGVYRMACAGIAAVWYASNGLGYALGRAAECVFGVPLWIGATFGGVDFLVVMGVIYGGWLASRPKPRWAPAVYGALAISGAHLLDSPATSKVSCGLGRSGMGSPSRPVPARRISSSGTQPSRRTAGSWPCPTGLAVSP